MPGLLLSARRAEARALDGMIVAGGKKEAGVAHDARAEASPVCTTPRGACNIWSVRMRVDNVGICVQDLRRSVAFYVDLGFETLSESERGVTVARGEAKLFLFEGVAGPAPMRELGLFGNPPGIDHVSFLVDDVDALHDELVARGIETAGAPSDQDWGARAFGLLDPDGNNLYFLRWL